MYSTWDREGSDCEEKEITTLQNRQDRREPEDVTASWTTPGYHQTSPCSREKTEGQREWNLAKIPGKCATEQLYSKDRIF